MKKKPTPAQQQYLDLKKQNKDALLFFRMGDFYETFYEDAHIAHKVLEITLTARDKNSEHPIPMAGIPHHALDKYTQKLLQAGYKVAVADQIGTPIPGKIVERKVVQVLTPGTVIEDASTFNYIAGFTYAGTSNRPYHIAWGDTSLGVYYTASFVAPEDAMKKIFQLAPNELIIDVDIPDRDGIEQYIHDVLQLVISFSDIPHDTTSYIQQLTGTTSLVGYGAALEEGRTSVVGLLLSYIQRMQQDTLSIYSIKYQAPDTLLMFDEITRANLEIFMSRYEGSRAHSLYTILHKTYTAGGARLLHHRLSTPICHEQTLQERFSYIAYYLEHTDMHDALGEVLKQLPDLARLLARIMSRHSSPRLVQSLSFALTSIYQSSNTDVFATALSVAGCSSATYATVKSLRERLEKILIDELIVDGQPFVREGYDTDIDTCRQVAYHADDLLLTYQQDVQKHSGAIKVKLKFVKNQGYILEVTPKDIEKFETYSREGDEKYHFLRGQTLKTGQRYITPYLQTLQEKIFLAKDELAEKEQVVFLGLIEDIQKVASHCTDLFETISLVDLSLSMALLAGQNNWILPKVHPGTHIEILKGRHPVVEHFLPTHESFIPNDLVMDDMSSFHILTGPNMGGKSTFLRQNALIILLAHTGLPVPADKAVIPLVDGLFARIGAGDALAKNQSTFMTEMLETANILHNATSRSFIILDELGRGTSTYDGLALAKSISVNISQDIHAKTLFATHYHELTSMEDTYKNVKNYSVSVYETDKEVIFMKKVIAGKANKSYGIDVAKLAGMPPSVIEEAIAFLAHYEQESLGKTPLQSGFDFGAINDRYKNQYDTMKDFLEAIIVDEVTPLEALVYLQDIKKSFPEL